MFCCACAGSCNHVGPHSFCEAHGGRPYGTVITSSGTNVTVEEPTPERRPGLSVGDAITVIALLAFAFGWVVFTTWDAADTVHDGQKLDVWTGVVWVLLVATPSMWAGRLAAHIVKGDADD